MVDWISYVVFGGIYLAGAGFARTYRAAPAFSFAVFVAMVIWSFWIFPAWQAGMAIPAIYGVSFLSAFIPQRFQLENTLLITTVPMLIGIVGMAGSLLSAR